MARVRIPTTSLPAPASERPKRPARAGRDSRQEALLLLLRAGDHDRSGRQPRQQEHQGARVRVLRDFLVREREAEDAGPAPTVFLGDAEPEQARIPERLEEVIRILAGLVDIACTQADLSRARRRTAWRKTVNSRRARNPPWEMTRDGASAPRPGSPRLRRTCGAGGRSGAVRAGQSAPDAVALTCCESVLEAGLAYRARGTDGLRPRRRPRQRPGRRASGQGRGRRLAGAKWQSFPVHFRRQSIGSGELPRTTDVQETGRRQRRLYHTPGGSATDLDYGGSSRNCQRVRTRLPVDHSRPEVR